MDIPGGESRELKVELHLDGRTGESIHQHMTYYTVLTDQPTLAIRLAGTIVADTASGR
jgi:hypothetical protein